MEDNKRKLFKKPQDTQFKRKGASKKGKWSHSAPEQPFGTPQPGDTVYRILCPSAKIGGVIGKGGEIIKSLRKETEATIKIGESVPGSDERVIMIFSPPKKVAKKENDGEDSDAEGVKEPVELHCAAQDALLKVHDRIVAEDLFGGMASDDENESSEVTTRLLVPNNMVGCILGKGGEIIQRLRSETGASIRVLPVDQLPTCALRSDELVQISGKAGIVRKTLYEVSTMLHQNPRKDKPPPVAMPIYDQSFHPFDGPRRDMLPPSKLMWNHRTSPNSMPPMSWMGGYGNQNPRFGVDCFIDDPPMRGGEPPAKFSMTILCPAKKIGGIIGHGGSNIKLLEQDTGAIVHVEDAVVESDERAIEVSAIEAMWNQRSQTIEAILQLQNKTSEYNEKGTITTRLLVPSSKVGCLLGQGGTIINEMRLRTQADIRVCPKEEKPKFASDDEELVQISGNMGVAKEALAEIGSRLRVRTLRDPKSRAELGNPGPSRGFGRPENIRGRAPPPSGVVGGSGPRGYDPPKAGGHRYEPQSYPVPPAATGYPSGGNSLEANRPNSGVNSAMEAGASGIPNPGEVAAARVNLQDLNSSGYEHTTATNGAFMAAGGQTMNTHQGTYQSETDLYSSYQNTNVPSGSYQQVPYQSVDPQQVSYQDVNANQNPYYAAPQQAVYASTTATQLVAYQSTTAPQPGVYPSSTAAPQEAYYNSGVQQGAYQY